MPTLYGRGPDERVYVSRRADDGTTTVQFGDGRTGARPPTGQENITALYRKGVGLIGQVRALPPERGGVTPAAALTAFTGPEHRASVLRAGFQLHVEKPFGLDALIQAVAMLALKERAP